MKISLWKGDLDALFTKGLVNCRVPLMNHIEPIV